ncbi:uncharacterized protein LOC130737250 [Lotus japonicus]|uniref:uncharacterized protein LOC130737250 n=1 Tax=Lotus japonicus TaxID=34305 RepID=UPI002583C84F|nr:uncharacterized protein LOC130737250 [Lotus japonicus]
MTSNSIVLKTSSRSSQTRTLLLCSQSHSVLSRDGESRLRLSLSIHGRTAAAHASGSLSRSSFVPLPVLQDSNEPTTKLSALHRTNNDSASPSQLIEALTLSHSLKVKTQKNWQDCWTLVIVGLSNLLDFCKVLFWQIGLYCKLFYFHEKLSLMVLSIIFFF